MSLSNDFLDELSAEVMKADCVSAINLKSRIDSYLAKTLDHVDADAECIRVAKVAARKATEFADIVGNLLPTEDERRAAEASKAAALRAIDAFRRECKRCGPSAVSRALALVENRSNTTQPSPVAPRRRTTSVPHWERYSA